MSIKGTELIGCAIVLLVFGILGTIDMLVSKMNFVKHIIHYIAYAYSNKMTDEKKREYEDILGTFSYDLTE